MLKTHRRLYLIIAFSCFLVAMIALAVYVNLPDRSSFTGSLNVLNWTSYVPPEVIREFEKRYQIKVNYGTYSSNEELLAKVSATPGAYDVVFPSDYMVAVMRERDLLSPLDFSKLPNQANLDRRFLNQPFDPENTYSLPFLLATSCIIYNSTETAPILSYNDLTRSDLKNNLVLLDDSRIVIGMLLLASGYSMNDTDPTHLGQALEFYERLRPNVKAFDSDAPKTFFITDEVVAGVIWNAEATLAKQYNPALVSVYPAEGFALSMDNYTIMKDSPNLDNAYLFINYLMEVGVARQIVAEYPYISAVSDVINVPSEELDEIFARGSYVENVGVSEIKLLDKVWAKIK